MKKIIQLLFIALLAPLSLLAQSQFQNFISVEGNKLMNGEQEFRFISFNVPTLNYNEDEFGYFQKYPYSLPDEFEIRDVFETVKQMGGQVIRMYTIPVQLENESKEVPTYVKAPGQFVEESFRTMDLVLALANEYEIRVIFSLLNNSRWMGGAPQYAYFRGKERKVFYTDPQLREDYKATINYVLNRKNTLTGVAYKDDKSILCWETGNELFCTPEWTADICKYIKSLDSNHLVMDGYFAFDDDPVRKSSVDNPDVDIISSHHYELNAKDFRKNVNKNIEIVDSKKPYIIGEYGFVSTTAMENCLDHVIGTNVSGILLWGLRGHRSEGGFYWHSEPLGYGRYKAYHWPGFASGNEYDEKALFQLMRQKAATISGVDAPTLTAPATPELLPITHQAAISWKGSTGASGYNVYRSRQKNGPYELIGYNVSDATNQYVPLFEDNTAEIGKSYFYKIAAHNQYGKSGFSNAVGPVKVKDLAIIDNMNNFGKVFFSTEKVTQETDRDRIFREDMYRLRGEPGEELIYNVPGHLAKIKIYSFCKEGTDNLILSTSENNDKYKKVAVSPSDFSNGKGDYGYWIPVIHDFSVEGAQSYLKIRFKKETQISRVELYYQ